MDGTIKKTLSYSKDGPVCTKYIILHLEWLEMCKELLNKTDFQEFLWTIGRNLDADIQFDDSWHPARKGSGGGEQKKEKKTPGSRRSSLAQFLHL